MTKTPYFSQLFSQTEHLAPEDLTFANFDESSFALFVLWLNGGLLHGPQDFHTFQHYLGLYVLAQEFGVEVLCNTGQSPDREG